MTNMRRLLAFGAASVAAYAARVDAQAACPPGIDRPSVTTLVASPNSDMEALVVKADCTFTRKEVFLDGTLMLIDAIERVDSVPSKTKLFQCTNCPLSQGFDLSAATGADQIVTLAGISEAALRNAIFPRSLKILSIGSMQSVSLDMAVLPTTLRSLSIYKSQLKAITNFPSKLDALSLSEVQLTSIDVTIPSSIKYLTLNGNPIILKQDNIPPALVSFSCMNCKLTSIGGISWPSSLTQLYLTENPIAKLDKVTLPSKLEVFSCADCGITMLRGVKWPSTLTDLNIRSAKLKEFEIRQSDVAIVEKLQRWSFDLAAARDKCSDSTAEFRRIGKLKVCVITDERFNQRYDPQSTSSDNPPDSDTSSASTSVSTSASSDSSQPSDPTGNGGGDDGSGFSAGAAGGGGTSTNPDDPSTDSREGSGTNAATTSSTSSTAVTIIVVIISVGVASALALIGLRYLSRRRHEQREGDKDFGALPTSRDLGDNRTETTPADGSRVTNSSSLFGGSIDHWNRDIRRDPRFSPLRIDLDLLKIDRAIARGGFGVIYKAEYNDEVVAVKRLSEEALRDDAKVYGFMDEIRMCATLKHPKIVTFIGVAWSTRRDISVVIEFMDGGDLFGLLQSQPAPASPQDWFDPWTATRTVKSKALIARDVVDALVYLHSFSPPILHRDLKARNVLLDTKGNAKLSDFGISRELNVDVTMTSEVGTVAWIAPEVLRGDRYSEKADIYSLGVLLVEIDRCRHPYADGMSTTSSANGPVNGSGLEFRDARIAMLVGAGQLRPALSADSPSSVRELVAWCLQQEAGDRPNSVEVLDRLQRMEQM